jgi:hypothetical protein
MTQTEADIQDQARAVMNKLIHDLWKQMPPHDVLRTAAYCTQCGVMYTCNRGKCLNCLADDWEAAGLSEMVFRSYLAAVRRLRTDEQNIHNLLIGKITGEQEGVTK